MGKVYASGGSTHYYNLPNAYTQVEYIESNGYEYIDSGVVLTSSIKVEADFQITEKKYGYELFVFGNCFDGSDAPKLRFGVDTNNVFNTPSSGNGTISCSQTSNIFARTTVTAIAKSGSSSPNTSIYIFKGLRKASSDSNSNAEGFGKIKLYSMKMYDSDTLIRHFVPCYRKIDNTRGLYDIINGIFYSNGNTVPSTYQLVEYLESTGTQYINTGYTTTAKSGCYLTFNTTSQIGEHDCGCMIGADDGSGKRYKLETWASEDSERLGSFWIGAKWQVTDPLIIRNEKITIAHSTVTNTNARNDNTYVSTEATPVLTNALYIFGANNEGVKDALSDMKLYSCYISESYKFAHSYIPVIRKSDNKPGLYDIITGEFLVNAGEDEFLYGNPIYDFNSTGIVSSAMVAHKVNSIYIGRDTGVAKKVKKVYIGDPNNVARLCFIDGQ